MDPLVIIHLRHSFVGKRKVQNTSLLSPNFRKLLSKIGFDFRKKLSSSKQIRVKKDSGILIVLFEDQPVMNINWQLAINCFPLSYSWNVKWKKKTFLSFQNNNAWQHAHPFSEAEYFHRPSFDDPPNSITNIWDLQKQTKIDIWGTYLKP